MKDKKQKAEVQRNYLRRMFLERTTEVPELIASLKEGVGLSQIDQWQFLTTWSQRWHLDAGWVRESAYLLLNSWPQRNSYRTKQAYLDSLVLTYIPPLPDVIYLPPTLPRYYYTMSHRTRGDYLKEARTVAEAYCKNVEAALRSVAFKDDPKRDIDWAVIFQVEKKTYQQIAEMYHLPVNANGAAPANRVREAVQRTLRILELKTRGR